MIPKPGEFITVTMPQLEAALLRWNQDARNGNTLSHQQAAAMPLQQVAAQSALYLWDELRKAGDSADLMTQAAK